jgi:hypothetical protein
MNTATVVFLTIKQEGVKMEPVHRFSSILKTMVMVLTLIGLFSGGSGLARMETRPTPLAAPAASGIIAYVHRSTQDIHVISPDGTGDRILWKAPNSLSNYSAYDLAWRRDGRELAFSSDHELTCSWYQSDVYAIRFNGTGYRRVTNSPACAVLATLPQGSVEVNVTNYTYALVQAYVQGAPGVQSVFDGTVTFNNVADFGPGVLQPAIGIYGGYRILANPPLADVQPGQTVSGGILIITAYSGIDQLGTGKVSWNADGSEIAYGMLTSSSISQIPSTPPYGSIGEQLPVVEHAWPDLVAWGPTAVTKDQYLYSSKDDPIYENIEGIYLNSVGNTSGGTKLVPISAYYSAEVVYDIEWLPDGSGFLYAKHYVEYDIMTNIFKYDLATKQITQLTFLQDDSVRGISISPDGQSIVLERVDEFDTTSSLWIMNHDGSGLHEFISDAGRPAWGPVPPPPAATLYLPLVLRSR